MLTVTAPYEDRYIWEGGIVDARTWTINEVLLLVLVALAVKLNVIYQLIVLRLGEIIHRSPRVKDDLASRQLHAVVVELGLVEVHLPVII